MKTKRILAIVLSVLMIMAVFTACGSKKEDSDAATSSGAESTKASEPVKEEPVTFTAFFAQPAEDWDKSQIAEYVREKTGVSLQIEYQVGDVNAKASVMIASGEYPDLLWGSEAQEKFITASAFIPLNSYIDKSENVKKLYDGYLGMMKKDDGNIYHLPWDRGDVVRATETSGFYIQRAVLKEFGYPKISTLQEYLDLIEKYKAKYPEINGKKTIGISLLTHDWRDFTIQNCPMNLIGYPNDGNLEVNQQSFDAKTFALNPEAKAFYQAMNNMYLKGILDPESFVANYDQWVAKCSSGAVLAIGYNQNWQVNDQVQSALRKQKMDDRMFVALPIVLNKGDKEAYQWPGNMVVRDGIGITTSCKSPDRAFKFLDFMSSEEVQKMLHWGIKEQDYTVDANGRMIQTPEQVKLFQDNEHRKKVGNKKQPWPNNKNVAKYADGNSWDPSGQDEVIQAGYDSWDKEVLNAYGAKVYADMFTAPVDSKYGVAWDIPIPDGHPARVSNETLRQVQKELLPKLMLAKAGQYDKIWAEYETKVKKIDLKTYEDFVTQGIKARVEKWSK